MSSPPLLLHVFSTFAIGGPQVRFATIANHFGREWRHAVVAMDGNLAARERLDPDLLMTYPDFALKRGDTLDNLRRMRAAIRQLRPHAMVTSNWGTIEWAMANRLKLVRHVHVEDGFGPEERSAQLTRRIWARKLFLAGRTVVVPSLTLQGIATEIWRLKATRVRYVPNGVDLSHFEVGETTCWPGDGPVIGTLAALRAEKNLARLIKAFASATKTRKARLVIAGDGPEAGKLRILAGELGVADRLHWAGHVTDAGPFLRSLDVFAMSSDTEQMPISLLEAMATGVAVAATDVGDIADMLGSEQRAFVVPPGGDDLSHALGRLIDDAALRRALGADNKARVAALFSKQAMLDKWRHIYAGEPA